MFFPIFNVLEKGVDLHQILVATGLATTMQPEVALNELAKLQQPSFLGILSALLFAIPFPVQSFLAFALFELATNFSSIAAAIIYGNKMMSFYGPAAADFGSVWSQVFLRFCSNVGKMPYVDVLLDRDGAVAHVINGLPQWYVEYAPARSLARLCSTQFGTY